MMVTFCASCSQRATSGFCAPHARNEMQATARIRTNFLMSSTFGRAPVTNSAIGDGRLIKLRIKLAERNVTLYTTNFQAKVASPREIAFQPKQIPIGRSQPATVVALATRHSVESG